MITFNSRSCQINDQDYLNIVLLEFVPPMAGKVSSPYPVHVCHVHEGLYSLTFLQKNKIKREELQ